MAHFQGRHGTDEPALAAGEFRNAAGSKARPEPGPHERSLSGARGTDHDGESPALRGCGQSADERIQFLLAAEKDGAWRRSK